MHNTTGTFRQCCTQEYCCAGRTPANLYHVTTKSSYTSESDSKGKNKGTDFVPPHEIDERHVDLHISCVEIENYLVTPSLLEDCVIDMNVSCDEKTEIYVGLSVPIAESNSCFAMNEPVEMISAENGLCDFAIKSDLDSPYGLSATIAGFKSYTGISVPSKIADENEACDMIVQPDWDRIKLVRHDDVLAEISHDNSLWSIAIDPPMSLSHARNKIAELTCLETVYAPNFIFNVIGDYGVDNEFLVHRICITCDGRDIVLDYKPVNMLNHFDMTSNFGITYVPNTLLQNCLFQHNVTRNFGTLHFSLQIGRAHV